MCFFKVGWLVSWVFYFRNPASFALLHQKNICFMSWALPALPPHFSDDELPLHCDLWTSEIPWWACLARECSTFVFCFNWQKFWSCKTLDKAEWSELQLDGRWGREGDACWKMWIVTQMTSWQPKTGSSLAKCGITAGEYQPIQTLLIPAFLAASWELCDLFSPMECE